MRTFAVPSLLLMVPLVIGSAACRAPEPEAPRMEYKPTATIKDIMDSLVDPSADFIWESVGTVVSAAGSEDRVPKTPEEWANVRRRAIALIESPNLLIVPGRRVARPGEKSENPQVELEPAEMQTLIDQDRQTFISLAHALQDAAVLALEAIDAKNAEALVDAGGKIDIACENCHLKYWYPNQKIPDFPLPAKP